VLQNLKYNCSKNDLLALFKFQKVHLIKEQTVKAAKKMPKKELFEHLLIWAQYYLDFDWK
jgi:hypothetical protein